MHKIITKEQVAEYVHWNDNERREATRKKPREEAPNELYQFLDDNLIIGELFDWKQDGPFYQEAFKKVTERYQPYYAHECDGCYQAVYSKLDFPLLEKIEG